MAVSRRRVYFVPPPQPDKPSAGDIFEVVEIGGEEEHGDDEDENEAGGKEPEAEEVYEERRYSVLADGLLCERGGSRWNGPMRKPRKKRSVMGWELRRQCKSPCFGC